MRASETARCERGRAADVEPRRDVGYRRKGLLDEIPHVRLIRGV